MLDYNDLEKKIKSTSKPLCYYVDINNQKYHYKSNISGIYCFWFDNEGGYIKKLRRKVEISGPQQITQSVTWDWNLEEPKVCLYIGKTTDIKERISKHLLLGTPTTKLYDNKNTTKINKINTSCQLRAGFDYLYLDTDKDIFEEMRRRLYLSILPEKNFEKRFYMEDYLIGKFLPWFNLDSER